MHHRRTIIIFTLFVLVAFLSTIFVFFYRTGTDAMVEKYIFEITNCGNLITEQDCLANPFCEAIYAPGCDDCLATEFRRCVKVSPALASQQAQEEDLCVKTGGQYYQNKYGKFCLCPQTEGKNVFDQEKGCVIKAE
ncbi:MAG: hypothetical protein RB292_03175 [Patescibacteria group bacterium]|jgi:hypothetical protein|nr:hypothetical protein [Patescibacteria group bacterium]